jgi:uncharacterized protein (TIGR03437 family)
MPPVRALTQQSTYRTSPLQSANDPVQPGSYVALYGTGDGAEQHEYTDGALVGITLPLAQNVTAAVGGENATVHYAGGAPGLVAGVLQVNIQAHLGPMPGAYPVVISCNGAPSQSSALLAVK